MDKKSTSNDEPETAHGKQEERNPNGGNYVIYSPF